jgi:hypothetical protein
MDKFMSSYTYIDLLIEVLSDHEKNLDKLVSRLENITPKEQLNTDEPYNTNIKKRVLELQSIINKYEKTLTKISNHCNIIDDNICKTIIQETKNEKTN